MSSEGYGLELLKGKWPELTAALEAGFEQSSDVRELVGEYAEAIAYWQRQVREHGSSTDLREYEVICDDLAVDIHRKLMLRGYGSPGV